MIFNSEAEANIYLWDVLSEQDKDKRDLESRLSTEVTQQTAINGFFRG